MFCDFSSAFNTIQPHLLSEKLLNHECACIHYNMEFRLPALFTAYLTNRPQHVKVQLRRKSCKSFYISPKILQMFCTCSISSVLIFSCVCWGGNISKKDRDRLDKIIKKAQSVIGKRQDKFDTHYQRWLTNKLTDIPRGQGVVLCRDPSTHHLDEKPLWTGSKTIDIVSHNLEVSVNGVCSPFQVIRHIFNFVNWFNQGCLLKKNIFSNDRMGGHEEQKFYPWSSDKFVTLSPVSGQLVLIWRYQSGGEFQHREIKFLD